MADPLACNHVPAAGSLAYLYSSYDSSARAGGPLPCDGSIDRNKNIPSRDMRRGLVYRNSRPLRQWKTAAWMRDSGTSYCRAHEVELFSVPSSYYRWRRTTHAWKGDRAVVQDGVAWGRYYGLGVTTFGLHAADTGLLSRA